MSYRTVKDGLVSLLGSIRLTESKEAFDFEGASSREYNNTFILLCDKGENDEEVSESIASRIYDIQEWVVQVAFSKSSPSDIVSRDIMLTKKDEMINVFDKPSNNTFTKLLKYKSWEISDLENYFLLTMKLKIIDTIVYS